MNSIYFLIYMSITQSNLSGMQIVEEHFPTLEQCHTYMEEKFLPEFELRSVTWNFYHSNYKMMVKDSSDGYMRTYMSCVEKPDIPCGFYWPCGDVVPNEPKNE